MRNLKNSGNWWVGVAMAALVVTMLSPSTARAQSSDTFWMAASDPAAKLGGDSWGRLMLKGGQLKFNSLRYDWQLALSDIKRVDISTRADEAFEIESATGEVFYVSILDAKLTTQSPRKARETIRKAVKDFVPTATLVAGGGSR